MLLENAAIDSRLLKYNATVNFTQDLVSSNPRITTRPAGNPAHRYSFRNVHMLIFWSNTKDAISGKSPLTFEADTIYALSLLKCVTI